MKSPVFDIITGMFGINKPKRVLSIDIGSTALKLVVVEISGHRVKLLKAGIKEYPLSGAQTGTQTTDDIIKNYIGEFLKNDALPKETYLVLSSPYVQIERVELPIMPSSEIVGAIKWRVKDKVSFDIDDAEIDYTIAEEIEGEGGAKQTVVLAEIADRQAIEKILVVMRELRLTVVNINSIPFCTANYLDHIKDIKPEEFTAFIEFGANHTYVSLYKSKRLMFVRDIPVSSLQITDSMCGVLVSDKGKMELSKEQAESIKRQFGFPDNTAVLPDGRISANQIIALVRPILEHIASEIKRTFTYYAGEFKGAEPSRIYLIGGGARLKNLDTFLSKELNVSVKYFDLPGEIRNETGENNEVLSSYLGAIGAVLHPVGGVVNLLPKEFVGEKAKNVQRISIRMVGFTAISILILLYAGIGIRAGYYKGRLDNARAHRNTLQEIITLYSKISQRTEAVSLLSSGAISGSILLKEISNIIPADIVLNRLNINFNKKQVVFKGVLHSLSPVIEDELTKFMEMLENSPLFEEANLVSAEKTKAEDGRLTANFEISCSLK